MWILQDTDPTHPGAIRYLAKHGTKFSRYTRSLSQARVYTTAWGAKHARQKYGGKIITLEKAQDYEQHHQAQKDAAASV